MKIVEVSTLDLVPYERNPRINDDAVESVAKSIETHGFNQPIVVNQDNVICVGHTRWKAAQVLGMSKVPVFKKKMTEAQFIAYNTADNRTAENSKWDNAILSELMQELEELDSELLMSTGFTDEELSSLLDDDEELEKLLEADDEDPEKSPKKKKGVSDRSHVRMVQIFFDNESFESFIKRTEFLQKKYETENLTDTVAHAVKLAYDECSKS